MQTLEPTARGAALSPPRALGAPPARALLRGAPEDFVVEEDLGFAPAGSGPHWLLRVRKRNANTQWVAGQLARIAGCRPREVGYAGLKDRRAIAVQWFSVPQSRAPVAWSAVREADFEVLEAHPHTRKLPRGALAGNRFTVRLGAPRGEGARLAADLEARLADIARRGVPNYFGPQRFGLDGANLARASEGLRRLGPRERGFVLSAARSALFNAVLAARVGEGSWEHLEPGDLAILDGRGSFFPVDRAADQTLSDRCRRLEIHPTGPMWGKGTPATGARVLELESRLAAQYPQLTGLCVAAGMSQERRSLRLAVRELAFEPEADAVLVGFHLPRGGFATAVLRELIEAAADSDLA
ncbi:MAG: tRNA pseudouridine(13) synthase TruD [Gammaproteobacteria bacterium]|nr:MAG: tRNA pseudouridine(13) synthase TruD [Gammaproteobacteria bacterium]